MTTEETNDIIDEMIAIEKFANNDAYANLQSKIALTKKRKKIQHRRRILLSVLSIATVMALVFFLGNKQTAVFNDTENVLVHRLPDGSTIHLNIGTEITYASRMKTERTIRLSGEAFFEVVPDATRPFSVYVADSKVTVLGTSFNIRHHAGSSDVEVFVKTGKVKLSSLTNDVDLEVADLGVVSDGQAIAHHFKDANYMAWADKKLIFNNDNLGYVLKTLAQCYQTSIELESDVFSSLQITTTFDDLNLEEILTSICLTLSLEYEKTDQGYLISQD